MLSAHGFAFGVVGRWSAWSRPSSKVEGLRAFVCTSEMAYEGDPDAEVWCTGITRGESARILVFDPVQLRTAIARSHQLERGYLRQGDYRVDSLEDAIAFLDEQALLDKERNGRRRAVEVQVTMLVSALLRRYPIDASEDDIARLSRDITSMICGVLRL